MMHPALVRTSLALGLALLPAPASAQKIYKNERIGFLFRVPKDFHEVPINLDEKWVVAKFLYKRPLEGKKEWIQLTPQIQVIVFPKFDPKEFARRRVKVKRGRKTVIELLENPYRNYKEYLRENYKKGGWHVDAEERVRVGGLPATYKKILVNQRIRGSEATAIVIEAWEIEYPDAVYVVQCEVLADYAHKFARPMRAAIKSFKPIPRTEALKNPVSTGGRIEIEESATIEEWLEKTKAEPDPKKRRQMREALLERVKAKAKETLPPGWTTMEKGHFLILYNKKVDKRFANMVAKQANLLWDWLNENLGFIGEDYPVGGVIRICNSAAEAGAYIDTSGKSAYSARTREIVIYRDRDYGFAENSWRLNRAIAHRFIADKNDKLWWSLPPWLDDGFTYYIGNLRMKGNKLISKPDEWDMEVIRDRIRKGNFKPAQKIVTAKYGESYNSTEDRVQALAICHFLMTKGRRKKKYQSIIPDYLRILDRKIRALEREWRKRLEEEVKRRKKQKKKDGEGGTGDDALDAWLANWKKKRNAIYEDCLKAVFGSWTERDWRLFEKDWLKAFKK